MAALLYVAHPTVHLDHLAAPWIHVRGTLDGMSELGMDADLLRFPSLVERFRASGGGLLGSLSKGIARARLVSVIVSASSNDHCLYIRHYHDIAPAYPLLRMLGRPFAVEVNATLAEEAHGLTGAPHWLSALAGGLETTALKMAPRVVAVSGVLRNRLVQRGLSAERVGVAHNGHDPVPAAADPCAVGAPAGGVLFVGNFKPWHRAGLLLEAYARLDASIAPPLVLVGSGDTSDLERQSEGLGIASRTEFLGRKERSEVAKLVARASILVLPSTEDYGSPVKVFEYLGAGRPTVLPDLPNIREVVTPGEHAMLFPPGDVDRLAATLELLLRDRDRAERIGAEGRRLASSQFTWRSNAEHILDILRADPSVLREVPGD